ncbi:MAG: hypothetical protein LRY71_09975 [Bacillaceae bacterium]|nr:hypothetical protein [Bacillaceae bacterium]
MKKYLLMLMLGLIATSLIACSSIGTSSATDKVVVGGKKLYRTRYSHTYRCNFN